MKFRPSNGTECSMFTNEYCDRCAMQNPDAEKKPQCNILLMAFLYSIDEQEYPTEWIYDNEGNPTCTKFKYKDWENDRFVEYRPPVPKKVKISKNQLKLF